MQADGDSLMDLHESALRHAAVTALHEWFSSHSRIGVSPVGKRQAVPTDTTGQQIARALMVLGEPLVPMEGR